MKKTILVTGGTGYIGSHTAVALIDEGYDVVIVDNLSNSKMEVLDGIEKITGIRPRFEQLDLVYSERVDAFFKSYAKISAVIHFAASKAVGESVSNPLKYYQNNLGTLVNVLQGMEKYDISNIVFSSSCTVYGQSDILPVTENTPIKEAMSPYGNTKQICEEILRDTVAANEKLSCVALRYFNPVGAHASALIGELPLGVPDNLVPFITQTAMGIREKLRVFGDDYNTPDGSCVRDYINVVDLAKAHVVSINRMINNQNKKHMEIFNLGTGNGVSVLEMIKTFEKVTGQALNYEIVARRAGDIEQVWADTSFANNELGWKTEANLEDTLLSAWNWEKHIRGKKS
ncbi:MAG: UDP-glucose 4-epimerase GalE [Nitrospira sp.]|nr:UDP-glucose 4-epimerase GalE [Nitrospira sp.]